MSAIEDTIGVDLPVRPAERLESGATEDPPPGGWTGVRTADASDSGAPGISDPYLDPVPEPQIVPGTSRPIPVDPNPGTDPAVQPQTDPAPADGPGSN